VSSQIDHDLNGTPGPGILTIDEDGKLLPVVHEIFELVAAHDALLATGHVSYEEHLAVARELGGSGRVLVTHVGEPLGGPNLKLEQCVELARLGAIIEFTAQTACAEVYGRPPMPIEENAAMIRAVGVERSILSTDYGWNSELPRPVPGLLEYVDRLAKAGFSEDELRTMVCDTPARLLGLAA
jgi:hypothetical protein